ncbi:MAG TPA: hypothetical protein VNP89_00895 [Gaiellaceae bacterium]|nr:hypothetical protein [Gaiellaceae bacterium]
MSEQMQSGQSRRGLLGRGLVLLAGVVGIGAGAGATKLATQDDEKVAAGQIRLHGRNWVLQTPDRRPGERIVAGERGTVYGELVDVQGKTMGQFYGSRMAAQSSPGGPVDADSSLELHTFRLEGGTLLGVGSTIAGESIFAIAGGTGRYAGSRGTYIAEQRLLELGGDGTAEFTIDLRA